MIGLHPLNHSWDQPQKALLAIHGKVCYNTDNGGRRNTTKVRYSMINLGNKIRELRVNKGLTQEQLATALNLSPQAISKWESGTSTPELEKLFALSECFNITLDELVKDGAANQEASETPQKSEKDVVSKAVEMKAGVVLCLIGAICLILSGITMVTSPRAADQLNAASTITISGSGVLLILCVLSMVVGFVLILRKK